MTLAPFAGWVRGGDGRARIPLAPLASPLRGGIFFASNDELLVPAVLPSRCALIAVAQPHALHVASAVCARVAPTTVTFVDVNAAQLAHLERLVDALLGAPTRTARDEPLVVHNHLMPVEGLVLAGALTHDEFRHCGRTTSSRGGWLATHSRRVSPCARATAPAGIMRLRQTRFTLRPTTAR